MTNECHSINLQYRRWLSTANSQSNKQYWLETILLYQALFHVCSSLPFPASSSVSEEAVLGPLLFPFVVNDLPDPLSRTVQRLSTLPWSPLQCRKDRSTLTLFSSTESFLSRAAPFSRRPHPRLQHLPRTPWLPTSGVFRGARGTEPTRAWLQDTSPYFPFTVEESSLLRKASWPVEQSPWTHHRCPIIRRSQAVSGRCMAVHVSRPSFDNWLLT